MRNAFDTLCTSWSEFDAARARIFGLFRQSLCIFDNDLATLGLTRPERIDALERGLAENPAAQIRIALKSTAHLHRDQPRLVRLAERYAHALHIRAAPESAQSLREALIVVDATHTLLRFDEAQPRARLSLDDAVAAAASLHRFEAIWAEGGTPFSTQVLGL
jgi:hypothetical protein